MRRVAAAQLKDRHHGSMCGGSVCSCISIRDVLSAAMYPKVFEEYK